MRNVSCVTWFKVIDDYILTLKFDVVAPTCDSFIFIGLTKSSISFANPTFYSATITVDNKTLSVRQWLLFDWGGMLSGWRS